MRHVSTRVRAIITDIAIPRIDGGVLLCHRCQRNISFAGGFERYLVDVLEQSAKHSGIVKVTWRRGASSVVQDEDDARAMFEAMRWKNGPQCPDCGHLKHYFLHTRKMYRCANPDCRRNFSPLTSTPLASSKLTYTQIIRAIELVSEGTNGLALARALGIQHRSSWKLMQAIDSMLSGLVLPATRGDRRRK